MSHLHRRWGLMFAGAHAFKGCAKRFSAVRILTSINPEDDEIISCTVDVRNTEPNSGRAWHVQPLTYSTGTGDSPAKSGGWNWITQAVQNCARDFWDVSGLGICGIHKKITKNSSPGKNLQLCSTWFRLGPPTSEWFHDVLPTHVYLTGRESEERRQFFFPPISSEFIAWCCMMLHVAWHLRLKSGVWSCVSLCLAATSLFFRQGPKPSDWAMSKMLQKP